MKDILEKIRKEAMERMESAENLDRLNEIRVAYLGKKGELTQVLKSMKDVAKEDRPKVGQMVNDTRAVIEERLEDIRQQIAAKQTEYDNLVKNLSAATFAPEIIQDLNNRLKTLRAEIEALETAEPPEEYSTNTILEWLKAIKAAPDRRAVHLLVDRIEVSSDKEKTDVNVISTLTSVGELVAAIRYGDSSDCLDSGRISGDAAKPRIRTDASRPFSLPQPQLSLGWSVQKLTK